MSWQAGIDAGLVARLVRTLHPGLIRLGLARRIVEAAEQIAGRLPLLARFPRVIERSRASEAPIVHALPAAGRLSADIAASPAREDRAGERALPTVIARVVEHERTIIELAAPPPVPSTPTASAPASRVEPASRTEPALRAEPVRLVADPPARRSRMGAPLAISPLPHVGPAAPPLTLANQPAPVHGSDPAVPPRADQAATSRPARVSMVVVPRLATPLSATLPVVSAPSAGALPVVAAPSAGPRPATSAVLPHPELAASARDLVVLPRRSPGHAQGDGTALAHVAPVPAPAPATTARPAPASAPIAPHPPAPALAGVAPPRAPAAASSGSAPLQRTDLPEIAVQVQRILERQAFHDRARRGLRR